MLTLLRLRAVDEHVFVMAGVCVTLRRRVCRCEGTDGEDG